MCPDHTSFVISAGVLFTVPFRKCVAGVKTTSKPSKMDVHHQKTKAKAAFSSMYRKAKATVNPSSAGGSQPHRQQQTETVVVVREGVTAAAANSKGTGTQTMQSKPAAQPAYASDYNAQWYSQMMQVKGISR